MLIINRANRYGALPADQIAKALNLPRFFAVPEDPKLRLALLKGQSIFELDPDAPSAQVLTQIAQAIWTWVQEPKTPATEEPAAAKVVS